MIDDLRFRKTLQKIKNRQSSIANRQSSIVNRQSSIVNRQSSIVMLIEFKTEGGFAYFPGLNKPLTIDSGELPEQEAGELQQMLQAARFFELPKRVGKISPQAADVKQYKVTIKDKKASHTVQMTDMTDDPHLQRLLSFLKVKASQQREAVKAGSVKRKKNA